MVDEQRGPTDSYGPENVQVVRGLEHIRRHPGMYIGDVGSKGLHWTVFQLVANSLAEAAEGYGRSLKVKMNADGSVEIQDGGRGIDLTPHAALGKPGPEAVLTELFTQGSDVPGRYWPDYAIANALSEWLHVESRNEGRIYCQEFRHGKPVAASPQTGTCADSGIKVRLKPDPIIFHAPRLTYAIVHDRLREYAFLHSGVRIAVSDEATGEEDQFEFAEGIRSFVQTLNSGRVHLHPEVLVVRGEQTGVKYEAGLQWCLGAGEITRSFVNDYETAYGGTHVTGLLSAVTRSVNSFIRKQDRRTGWMPKARRAHLV